MNEKKIITINNLEYSYNGNSALEGINCEISESSFLAVLGPNGSGKTTLLKILLGIIRGYKGEIKIDGKDPIKTEISKIGYVPQIKTLDKTFPAKVEELVASGIYGSWPWRINNNDSSKIDEILDSVGAGNLRGRFLQSLSGGELQRIYLARAMIRMPKILLLDEPATGIDLVCETNINHLLEKYNKENGITVIMVTHNWATAEHHADNILLLNKKQIKFGKTQEVLKSENLSMAFKHFMHIDHIHRDEHV